VTTDFVGRDIMFEQDTATRRVVPAVRQLAIPDAAAELETLDQSSRGVRSPNGVQGNPRPHVFGIPIHASSMATILDTIDHWINAGERQTLCTMDVHALMESLRNAEIRRIYMTSTVTPDGMPIVWLLRRHGWPAAERICGPDLMPAVFRRSETCSYRHFLYGSSEGTLHRLRTRLSCDFPASQIVGSYAPPFRMLSETENAEVVAMLNAARPDIIWVGLGAPKQDRWMAANRSALQAPVLIGVGAAFDMLAGNVRRAPSFVQYTGFEWLFRLAQEPRRLGKRYLKSNSQFVFRVAGETLGLSKPSGHS
jgi:N-acetylglucosaminyldiphosphoundecaprenol N-acetyl-beta-D-mannosaminyltransferase